MPDLWIPSEKACIDALSQRRLFFQNPGQIRLAHQPGDLIRTHLAALSAILAGDLETGAEKLEEMQKYEADFNGLIDGFDFNHWQDADDYLGPCLEFLTEQGFFWYSNEHIQSIEWLSADVELPGWLPLQLVPLGGKEQTVWMPVEYIEPDNPDEEFGEDDSYIQAEMLTRYRGIRHWHLDEDIVSPLEFIRIERASSRIRLM